MDADHDPVVPVDPDFASLRGPVEVITDASGMPHIFATNIEDAFFVQGYLMARDRFAQMELYRRISTGTLSEVLGELSDETVEVDVLFRTLGLKRKAEELWAQGVSEETRLSMESFAAGFNAWLARYRLDEERQAPVVEEFFTPQTTREWEPTDTAAIARLLAVSLTYQADIEVEFHAFRQLLLDTFDADSENPDFARRDGFFQDFARFEPSTTTTHIDGFPALYQQVQAPRVSRQLSQGFVRLHRALASVDGFAHVNPFRMEERASRGSNNWVVAGRHNAAGAPVVANDPHLGLSLPTVFYPIRIEITDDIDGRDDLELVGAAYPGVPGIVIGRNRHVAWGTTVGFYDYVDVYLEEFSGPAQLDTPPTVRWRDMDVPVRYVVEEIGVGNRGVISETFDYVIEIVDHHGPLMPAMIDHRPVLRTESEGLSVRWVGHEANDEFLFPFGLFYAQNVRDVQQALTHYWVGSSNFVFGFTNGDIFYSGRSNLPVRDVGAFTYDAVSNPWGTAPTFILPGDGTADWIGFVPDERLPQALNPENGYVITANNDPVGVTLDGNPFNDEYYLGSLFATGFRAERIEELFADVFEDGRLLSLEDHFAIQDDGMDTPARRIVPHIIEAIDVVLDDGIDPDTRPDLAHLRSITANRRDDLVAARQLLESWDFVAPKTRQPQGEDIVRSSATVLFHAAMVYVARRAFGDELGQVGIFNGSRFRLPLFSELATRVIIAMLEKPQTLFTWDEAIGDTWIFDDMRTPEVVETRLSVLVLSVLDAMDRLASASPLGQRLNRPIPSPASTNPADWVWGRVHGLRLESLLPFGGPTFERPSSGLPFYERQGGELAVTPCNHGMQNFDFTCGSGSALRMVHVMDPQGPVTYNAIPGGASANPASPFFDNELEIWQDGQPREIIIDRQALEQRAYRIETFANTGISDVGP